MMKIKKGNSMSEERKIRIVHIAQSPGGVERYLRSLLKYSNREKYEIILIVSNQYKRKNYVNLVDAFENVDMIRSIDPKSDLNAIKAIRKLLKKYKPLFIAILVRQEHWDELLTWD